MWAIASGFYIVTFPFHVEEQYSIFQCFEPNVVCLCLTVGAVSFSSPTGFGSFEDDLRGAGVSKGRPECCKERRAEKTLTGANSHCTKPAHT